jgi:hypothetical protein
MDIEVVFNERLYNPDYYLEICVGQYPNGIWDYGIDYSIGTGGGGCIIDEENLGDGYSTRRDAIYAALDRAYREASFAYRYLCENPNKKIEPTSPTAIKIQRYIEMIRRCMKSLDAPKQLSLFD